MTSTTEDVESAIPKPSSSPMEGAPSVAIPRSSKFWLAPWTFLVHGFVATSIFMIIAGFAVGLDIIVRWLEETIRVSPWIILLLHVAEYLIFLIDLFLYVVFLSRTACRTYRDMKHL